MLPTELLMFRVNAGLVTPKRLKPTPGNVQLTTTLVTTFEAHVGKRRFELNDVLKTLEAGRSDYRVLRGLAHLLASGSADFQTDAPVEPAFLRSKVFELAQEHPPARHRRPQILEQVARELGGDISGEELVSALYADLPDQQTLVRFEAPEPRDLLERFNLAQAQGVLYRAFGLIVTARRNEPARYKQLLKYTKLFGLMVTVEGDADYGFTLTFDGPTSLFSPSTRYGLALAKFLPALLHVTKWDLTAVLRPRRDLAWVEQGDDEWRFELTSEDGYVSHYAEPKDFDSALESAFAERFEKAGTDWTLEREVDLVPVPGGVIIPDFRLVHPDGRSALLEIVGYWRPDYLRKKFALLKKSGRHDVILAVSERLNLDKAGVDVKEFGNRVVFFKGVLPVKDVMNVLDGVMA